MDSFGMRLIGAYLLEKASPEADKLLRCSSGFRKMSVNEWLIGYFLKRFAAAFKTIGLLSKIIGITQCMWLPVCNMQQRWHTAPVLSMIGVETQRGLRD